MRIINKVGKRKKSFYGGWRERWRKTCSQAEQTCVYVSSKKAKNKLTRRPMFVLGIFL